MPRDALTFVDLVGKLDRIYIVCTKCNRRGSYLVHKLAAERPNLRIPDWIGELTGDCPRRNASGLSDPCGARCPSLIGLDL
jgi:hypothetical protein